MDTSVLERVRVQRKKTKKSLIAAMGLSNPAYNNLIERGDMKLTQLVAASQFLEVEICYMIKMMLEESNSESLLKEDMVTYQANKNYIPKEVYKQLLNQIERKDAQMSILNKIIEKNL